MKAAAITAASRGILVCLVCRNLSNQAESQVIIGTVACARCGSLLCLRKRYSLQRTLALLIAAAILYVPANVLPMLQVSNFGHEEDDTIFSGVVALWSSGSWPLALLVFCASILVPVVKLSSLSLLLLSTYRGWQWRLHERTVLFRLIDFIGRWSMLDVFVVALLVALVQVRAVASVQAGPAVFSFAGVVVLTMYAVHSFDPRLMWDQAVR